jgi:hypothetical protein
LRIGVRFPDVPVAYEWLMEILWRVQRGILPVTKSEFAEWGAWFEANAERLERLADSSGLFDVGAVAGRAAGMSGLRCGTDRGPRGAGEVAEDIRQLRAQYGGPG